MLPSLIQLLRPRSPLEFRFSLKFSADCYKKLFPFKFQNFFNFKSAKMLLCDAGQESTMRRGRSNLISLCPDDTTASATTASDPLLVSEDACSTNYSSDCPGMKSGSEQMSQSQSFSQSPSHTRRRRGLISRTGKLNLSSIDNSTIETNCYRKRSKGGGGGGASFTFFKCAGILLQCVILVIISQVIN